MINFYNFIYLLIIDYHLIASSREAQGVNLWWTPVAFKLTPRNTDTLDILSSFNFINTTFIVIVYETNNGTILDTDVRTS